MVGGVMRRVCSSVLVLWAAACAPTSDFVVEDDDVPDTTGCDDAFCESGLRIALVTPAFLPGAYSLILNADGAESACAFVIGGLQDGCVEGPCLVDDDCGVIPNLSFPPHSVVVPVGPGAPQRVTISVLRGGQEIAASTFSPTYQILEPAGPGCEPLCEIASAQLDIP